MDLDSYLADGERIAASATATDSKSNRSDYLEGTLACTTDRVVFGRWRHFEDISLRSINSIQYSAPTYPIRFAQWGIPLILVGALFWAYTPSLPVDAIGPADLGQLAVVAGVGALVVGLSNRRHVLVLRTPSESFESSSDSGDIENVAHGIRANEPWTVAGRINDERRDE